MACGFCNAETDGLVLWATGKPSYIPCCVRCHHAGLVWAIRMARGETVISLEEFDKLREENEKDERNDAEVIRGLKEALELANQKSKNLLEEIRILHDQLRKHGIGFFSLHPEFPHQDIVPK